VALHSGLWLFQCATWQALLQYLWNGYKGRQGKQQQQQQHSEGRRKRSAVLCQ
jgi:hypothetical protein